MPTGNLPGQELHPQTREICGPGEGSGKPPGCSCHFPSPKYDVRAFDAALFRTLGSLESELSSGLGSGAVSSKKPLGGQFLLCAPQDVTCCPRTAGQDLARLHTDRDADL